MTPALSESLKQGPLRGFGSACKPNVALASDAVLKLKLGGLGISPELIRRAFSSISRAASVWEELKKVVAERMGQEGLKQDYWSGILPLLKAKLYLSPHEASQCTSHAGLTFGSSGSYLWSSTSGVAIV